MDEEERKKPDVAREYPTQQIVVTWEPKYCIHTANCLNAEPDVFDAMRRPWIVPDAATAERVAEAVMHCPTGALQFQRLDGGAAEPVPTSTVIQPRPNGPLFLRGDLNFVDVNGEVTRETVRAALCRCGQSRNKPFCDATHRAIGFQAP